MVRTIAGEERASPKLDGSNSYEPIYKIGIKPTGGNEMSKGIAGYKSNLELIFEIDREQNVGENALELINRLKEDEDLTTEIIAKVIEHANNPIKIYNMLAVTGFENKVYDFIIPTLQQALKIDGTHKDTLVNISVLLAEFGEVELALNYANSIREQSEDVKSLIQSLTDRIIPEKTVKEVVTQTNQKSRSRVKLGENTYVGEGYMIVGEAEAISIGKDVEILQDSYLIVPELRQGGGLTISDGCQIGKNLTISVANKVFIDKHVIMASNVYISDCGHAYEDISQPIRFQGASSTTNKVYVGEGTWLGVNSVIVGNVRIGRGSVIGANTFVNKDVPDFSVAVGNPAKIIKMFDPSSMNWIKVSGQEDVELILDKRFEQPLISICIPTFNRAGDLERCLESIYSQIGDHSLFEIFISNNASTDHTEDIVTKYMREFSNITYWRNSENIGGDQNIAVTMQKSKGKYILLHGDDDFFNPGILNKILGIIMNNQECGLYFLYVLNDNKEVRVLKGMDQFLRETSIYSTFMSSIIIPRAEFLKLEDPFKLMDTNFNQVYLQYSILENNPNFCIINDSSFSYAGNQPEGYSFAKVFMENYFYVINFFKDKGLSDEVIQEEKKKTLYTMLLPRLHLYHQNNMHEFISDFEDYFIKYYKEESYFEHAHEIVAAILR
jgi:acetyltransferase-like isoleucine patch superfamily enzyme/glycosyltransferase involved in cell wall biosynthesis